MSGTTKVFLYILAAVVGLYLAFQLLGMLVSAVLQVILPLAIVAGIAYAIYLFSRKALSGGRRTLP